MPLSRVIRIDQEVWAELQRRARPLEDTPNSVLRRVFSLPDNGPRTDTLDPTVSKLLALVQDLVGQTVRWQPHETGYAVLGRTEKVVAHIEPRNDMLRVVARKDNAGKAGLHNWENEWQDRTSGSNSVRWYVRDGDDPAYKHVAAVLEKLWSIE